MSSSMYSVMDGRHTNMTSELTHASAMPASSRLALEWKKAQLLGKACVCGCVRACAGGASAGAGARTCQSACLHVCVRACACV